MRHRVIRFALVMALAGCASGGPPLPYPAFIAVDELPSAFIAGLPGVRAKQLSTDPRTRRVSYRIAAPPDWSFTTGGSPGHSVEIYVLAGNVQVGEFSMTAGGYVYIPPGMPGVQMSTTTGLVMLYFVDEPDAAAVIQTPIISSSNLIEWQPVDVGTSAMVLRDDPGSGARTWLKRMTPQTISTWQRSSQIVEGYLVDGAATYSECVAGEVVSDEYLPGGYFHRPPGVVHGGPDSHTGTVATWLLRTPGPETIEFVDACVE